MWNGFGYLPRHRGSSICAIFFQLRGSGSLELKTGAVVLAQIVHHAEEAAIGREADLVAGREDLVERHLPVIVVDLLDRVLVRRILVELEESHRLEILFGVEDDLASAQPHDGGRPTSGRMPYGAVGAAETMDVVAGDRPLFDEQFAHRHHFPFDLLTLGAEIVVLAGLRIGIDFGYLERAAFLPTLGEIAHVGHPVVFDRGDDPRGAPVKARRDVLSARR